LEKNEALAQYRGGAPLGGAAVHDTDSIERSEGKGPVLGAD
jgi:hypothetical protein